MPFLWETGGSRTANTVVARRYFFFSCWSSQTRRGRRALFFSGRFDFFATSDRSRGRIGRLFLERLYVGLCAPPPTIERPRVAAKKTHRRIETRGRAGEW